jgi:hypothetical protein
MNLPIKLLKYAWLWTGVVWLVSDVSYIALMVFASGKDHRYFDAAAGHIFEISVGRGEGRTVYVTHTYLVIYNGLLDLAMSCLGVFMLGLMILVAKAQLKKTQARRGL